MYCIYRVTNCINGKTYIGQHRYEELDDDYMGSGVLLHKAYKKYGIENFKKEIICKNVQYKETIDDMEKFYIKKERELNPFGCYNIADGGEGFTGHHSEESRKKVSETLKGRPAWNKGKHHSEETKKKIGLKSKGRPGPNRGKHMSEEQKKKISDANKGNKNPFYGKHHSDETKRKISEACKGEIGAWKGKCFSEEHKRNLSEAHKGKHWKLVDGKRVWY